jgi:hypothetical protein
MKKLTRKGIRMIAAGSIPVHGLQARGVDGMKRILTGLVLAAAMIVPHGDALAMSVNLGTAAGFGALAGSAITFSGGGPTTITGNIGVFPTATINGLANLILNGVNHAGDATTQMAKTDLSAAYADAAGRAPTTLYGAVYDLGGQTLAAGVYNGSSSLAITGNLTLDAGGDPNAVWIFQAGSTLITAVGSQVILKGGAQAKNVIWQVGSSATLNTSSIFVGDILALSDITLNTGAKVDGRVLALNGALTFNNNTVTVPEAGTLQLLGLGMGALVAFRRKRGPSSNG